MKNYYQVLGLNEDATQDEIKSAYKKYVVKFHPDKHNGDSFFKERLQEIQEAYDFLITHHTENCKKSTIVPTGAGFSVSHIQFRCSHKNIYEGDSISFKWDIDLPCSVSLKIVGDNSYQYKNDLSQHGTFTIHIEITERLVATLYCTNNNQTFSKEIHLEIDKTVDIILGNDKHYLRLVKTKKYVDSIFKSLSWLLTILYIWIILRIDYPFPTYTDITILNTIIEWLFYLVGWAMICWIVPLVLRTTFPIDSQIKEYARHIASTRNL